MHILNYGINEHHKIDEVTSKMCYNFWGIFHFHTPYSYELNGKMVTGNANEILVTPPNVIVRHGPAKQGTSFRNDWIYFKFKNENNMDLLSVPLLEPFAANNTSFLSGDT